MTKYIEREISKTANNALKIMPVVVITGMRQVGKSTLLRLDKNFKHRRYISLDDFTILEAAKRNPEALLDGDEALTIDEAQKCPELLVTIKKIVDKRRSPGRFLLSGSANFSLLKGITESLAGRALYLTLSPFTRREITQSIKKTPFLVNFIQNPNIPPFLKYDPILPKEIITGGMPPVCLDNQNHTALWFKGYEQTYLERDMRELSQVADLLSFRNVMQLASLRTGQVLKISELARDAKLNSSTTSRYLNLIETSFIIKRLLPYLRNKASRLIKSPKIYIADSGLSCYLTGIKDISSDSKEPLRGAMIETYIAQNLAGIIETTMPEARLFFWNIQGRFEVDFVIEQGREVIGIEIKGASIWSDKDLTGLKAFLKSTPQCKAAILGYNGSEAVQLDKKLWVIPLSLLLS